MIPALPFIIGLVAGAAAASALRSERGRAWLGNSAQQMRQSCEQAESQFSATARSGLERLRAVLPAHCGAASDAAPKEPAASDLAATATAPAQAPERPRKRRSAQPESGPDASPRPRTRRSAAQPKAAPGTDSEIDTQTQRP